MCICFCMSGRGGHGRGRDGYACVIDMKIVLSVCYCCRTFLALTVLVLSLVVLLVLLLVVLLMLSLVVQGNLLVLGPRGDTLKFVCPTRVHLSLELDGLRIISDVRTLCVCACVCVCVCMCVCVCAFPHYHTHTHTHTHTLP